MKVKELMEKLHVCDPDTEVYVDLNGSLESPLNVTVGPYTADIHIGNHVPTWVDLDGNDSSYDHSYETHVDTHYFSTIAEHQAAKHAWRRAHKYYEREYQSAADVPIMGLSALSILGLRLFEGVDRYARNHLDRNSIANYPVMSNNHLRKRIEYAMGCNPMGYFENIDDMILIKYNEISDGLDTLDMLNYGDYNLYVPP